MNQKNHFSLRARWLSLSIRYKIVMFLIMVVLLVLIFCIFSLGITTLHMQNVNETLGDSYAVNLALNSFDKEREAFVTYATEASEINIKNYQNAQLESKNLIADLQLKYENIGINRYLLTQAIQNAHAVFVERCDKLLQESNKDDDYINQYYDTLNIAVYISDYMQELMQNTLTEGIEVYNQKIKILQFLPVIAIFIAILIIIFAGLFSILTIRHIVFPVLQLAEDAHKISENTFDFPDMHVDNRDEIGQLVNAVNKMKHAMKSHIDSLKEYGRIEKRLHQEELQRIAMEHELRNMQFSMLQSQINPHFLYNTLNTICNTSKIEGAKYTEELIRRLANLFRYNLDTAGERVSMERELTIIQDYIFIQQRRFGHRLVFEVDCQTDISQITIPTFTLQPLIENAIIHGIGPREEGGNVWVRIKRKGRLIIISIVDNGVGIKSEQLKLLVNSEKNLHGHISHIGIGNVRKRLEILYPGSSFKIFSRVGFGTIVRLTLQDLD